MSKKRYSYLVVSIMLLFSY